MRRQIYVRTFFFSAVNLNISRARRRRMYERASNNFREKFTIENRKARCCTSGPQVGSLAIWFVWIAISRNASRVVFDLNNLIIWKQSRGECVHAELLVRLLCDC